VSDFHDVSFTAVGLVSSVRYPYPNHNLKPVPMIAIHGTDDGIDPYWGGGPEYWGQESVPQAIDEWSQFNGCQHISASESTSGIVIYRHTQCTEGADVVLVSVEGGGHIQPILSWNASRPTIRCGLHHLPVAYVNVTGVVLRFFLEHGAAATSHKAAQPSSDSSNSPTSSSVAFKGELSLAMSKSEVQRGVDLATGQLPASAGQAQQSLSSAKAACIVTFLASITTALVSVTLFFFYCHQSRKSSYNYTSPDQNTVRFVRRSWDKPATGHRVPP